MGKWNKFVSSLVEYAALPKTCLVRLTFTNSEGTKHEINNYDDLKQLSLSHGIISDNKHCITMNIDIEVLALTFDAYQKRFKYEQDEFMMQHKLNLSKNNISDTDKQLLSKFILSPLTTTKATISKQIKSKQNAMNNDIINDIMENVVNPKQANSEPPLSTKSASESINTSSVHIKKKLSATINQKLPLISFEELRFKHYMESKEWNASKGHKLIILNWPHAMNKDTLNTIFSSHGNIIDCDVNDKFAVVEYEKYDSAQQAIAKFNGFQLGNNKMSVQYLQMQEAKEEIDEKEENEENAENECTKLVIGNWPSTMNETLLKTLFSRFGQLKTVSIVSECGMVEYFTKSEADKAMQQMNGFKIGDNKLMISIGGDQVSHILNMEKMKKTEDDDEDTQDLIDGFEQIEKPRSPKQKSEEIKQSNSSKMEENEKETPNETDIAEMVRTENEKEFSQIIHDEKQQNQNDKNEEDDLQNAESAENDSSSSSDSDSSSFSDSSSSESIPSKNMKRKNSKNIKLSKKQLKKLKQKEKRRKRRKA